MSLHIEFSGYEKIMIQFALPQNRNNKEMKGQTNSENREAASKSQRQERQPNLEMGHVSASGLAHVHRSRHRHLPISDLRPSKSSLLNFDTSIHVVLRWFLQRTPKDTRTQ